MEKFFTHKLGKLFLFLVLTLCADSSLAQRTVIVDSTNPYYKKAIAGKEYRKSGMHQWLWGKDYRKEWTTPALFSVLNLDSAFGGLVPVKEGGGRQTKSLHLVGGNGKHYMLRTVNKSYLGALPEIVQGTFIESLANDQIATNQPYAALTVPSMAEAAGIYHTNPVYYIVPYSERLGKYNSEFANSLCLLEERPDESQTDNASFGNPTDIIGTEKMLEKILKENEYLMDQNAYVKTRLFDMFVGDWGRHEDNWRWSVFDSASFKIFRPVPKDRDQTYAKFEGKLLGLIIKAGKFKELQTFDDRIKSIKWYNYPAYSLDKRFTNDLTLQVWIDSARALQQHLTDDVIENAVKEMPPQIFSISGPEIIRKLKSRRDHLVEYAKEYYVFLANEVEIPGSKSSELFEVKRVSNEETSVAVYKIAEGEIRREQPLYSRTFSNKETKEIRIYGVGGHDIFTITGVVDKSIKIRVIGGPEKDSLIDVSYVGGWGHQTKYYDNPGNTVVTAKETNVHTSKYPSINRYDYDVFRYNSRGIKPTFYFNNFYRFYVGLDYSFAKDQARDGSFGARHSIGINYSLLEKSFNPYYRGSFTELLGRWNLNLNAGYDGVRRLNYFGVGNETVAQTSDISFYWMRMKTIYAGVGIDQSFLGHHNLRLDFLYNAVKVIDDEGRFTSKTRSVIDQSSFNWKQFGEAQLSYSYLNTDSRVLPTKGISFQLAGSYIQNIKDKNRFVRKGTSFLNLYIPVFKPFSIAIKSGGAYLAGNPEFYQYNNIGGFYTVRGFWRYRFWGKASFYNQNELRWLPTVKGHFYSGKIGLFAFYDQGRVWQPGENSDKWHYGYGGGFLIVPFNKIAIAATYGISDEGRRMNLRLGRFL